MTTGVLNFKSKDGNFIVYLQHDAHPSGLYTKPLFKFLKNSKKVNVVKLLNLLAKLDQEELDYSISIVSRKMDWVDVNYEIDLDKRTWKCDGYKLRIF